MRYSCCTVFAFIISLGPGIIPAIAQIQPNAGTTVTPVGGNQLNITGNQVSGQNQFHNFQTFNVNSGQTANFIPNNVNIQNILSRVSGGTPSQIQGVIQSASGVNLFLMNPAGILFGNGASLNLTGSFTATSANAIGFGNNLWFNAAGNSNLANLTGAPTQFAFTNNNPSAIVNTGNLTLPANQSLNLIGGTVINTGTLDTPGGNINIVAVEGGKAVQISAPGSILSYTLPVDAINAINPAIGSPVSLPELLTGNTLDNASGIEIKNGVVTLVRSQTPLADRSGLAVVSGTIATDSANGGTINVLGKTIAIADPTLTTEKAAVLFNADRRLVFEDQADNELTIGKFPNSTQSVTFKTNSTNGIIESIDPNDKIAVSSGPLSISAGSIKLGDLEARGSDNGVGLTIIANNDIQLGNVIATGAIQISTDFGNIKAGRISSFNDPIATTLTSKTGSIEVTSISAGGFIGAGSSSNLVLDIFAGKTFRAIGTISGGNFDTYSYSLRNANDQIFGFLATQTGKSIPEVKASLPGGTSPRVNIPSPVSIAVFRGGLRIRYMGGGGIENKPNEGISIQGGNNRFEIGPKATPNNGTAYIPTDNTDSFSNFITKPFDITENVSYQKIKVSEGASGTIGAIIRGVKLDGSLSIGTQDLAFGVLPTKPDPKPETKFPTIDLETRNTKALAACPQSQTIASATPEPTRSPNVTDPKATKDPCKTNDNDDEILKILK